MPRRNTNGPTFIGPIVDENRAGTKTASFMILQAGSGAIKLEYPDKAQAKAARDQLLLSHNTHKVPSEKLLQAIIEATTDTSWDEPGEA